MIAFMKRFSYWPLLAVGCMVLASAISTQGKGHGSTAGAVVGLALSFPIAAWIDRRHARRRIHG